MVIIIYCHPLTVSVKPSVLVFFSDNLYLFTISLASEKPLTVAYSFIMFSKHSNWHSFVTWTSHCSTILLHNDFARGEVWTSSTTLSTRNDESLPVFVCLLKDSFSNAYQPGIWCPLSSWKWRNIFILFSWHFHRKQQLYFLVSLWVCIFLYNAWITYPATYAKGPSSCGKTDNSL